MITIVGPQLAASLMAGVALDLQAEGHEALWHVVDGGLHDISGIEGTEIFVTIAVPCGASEMDRMPRLRGIVSPLLGYDWIDLEEATRRRIPVANGEVAENRESMAEATIMLLLALLYRLHETEAALRTNNVAPDVERRMLKGRTVGIIGYGGITRALIRRLAPWGCELIVSSRAAASNPEPARFVALPDLLATSDVIVVLTSLEPGTRHLLGVEQLRNVKAGVILVNTARGGLINEDALVDALRSGRISAAALDVFEHEPLRRDHPLRDLPNVILTPHAIGHTAETRAAVPRAAVSNVLALLDGKVPASCRNPEIATV